MSFETKVEFGGGKWNKGRRDHVLPIVESSIALAAYGLGETGVESKDQTKTASIFLASHCLDVAGMSSNANDFELYLPYRFVKHRKTHLLHELLPGTSFHELAHCLRFERFPIMTLAEAAATEGLANVGESEFEQKILSDDEHIPLIHQVPELTPDELKALAEIMMMNGGDTIPADELDAEYYDAWDAVKFSEDTFATTLDVLGIGAVLGLQDQGASYAEIFEMPAADIIQLGTGLAA